ncbi:MAG: hypothetical protein KKA35_15940, partial [Proteobacteria bacterium]|nr:hypothetical protein [Pseudomonadota bacterium]
FLSIILYFSSSMGSSFNYLINELDDGYELKTAIQILQRGYLLIDNDAQNIRGYFDCFNNTYNEFFPDCGKPTYKKFKAAYDFLFYQTGNYQNLENELLNHSLFMRITKDKILVDCTSLNMILTSFLEGFKSLDGEYANKISESYERIINEKIISIFGKESHFHKGELTNEKGEKKEIDASFIIDDVLFLIECKSLSVSQGSILGEYGAIEFRKKKLLEFLKEIESKARFIKNSKSLSKQIPEKVKYIVPIVSTSYPEFIWENNEELFIYESIPRFMTIKELDKLKSLEIINSIKEKSYTIKLHDKGETV